ELVRLMALDPHTAPLVDDRLRKMFTREAVLASDWYHQRLAAKQQRDIDLWERHVAALEQFLDRPRHPEVARRMDLPARVRGATRQLGMVSRPDSLARLRGTIGADPLAKAPTPKPAPRGELAAVS